MAFIDDAKEFFKPVTNVINNIDDGLNKVLGPYDESLWKDIQNTGSTVTKGVENVANTIGDAISGKSDLGMTLDYLDHQYELNEKLMNSANEFSKNENALARAFNAYQQKEANDLTEKLFNKSLENNNFQAALNREWQEKMSNSAIQRATEDYRKAGLNPYLAYAQGGAPVTSGATASVSAPKAGAASAYAASGHSASVGGSLGKLNRISDIFGTLMNTALSLTRMGMLAQTLGQTKPMLTEKAFTYDSRGRRTSEYWTYSTDY